MTRLKSGAASLVRPLFFLLCLFLPFQAVAQRQISASVESKTLSGGKKTVSQKEVYCRADGGLVVHTYMNQAELYFMVSRLGVCRMYSPLTNEVINDVQGLMAAEDELLYLFANGRGNDLGLSQYEYVISSSNRDGVYLKREFTAKSSASKCAKVEIAYKDFLPICAIYYDKKGNVMTKTYLSNYEMTGSFTFPKRVTEVTYFLEKGDSTVRLDIYSNIKVNQPDPMFDFEIPSDAKVLDMKELQKQLKQVASEKSSKR